MWKIKKIFQDEVGSDGDAAGGVAPVASAPVSEPAVEPAVPAGVQDGAATLEIEDIASMMEFDPFDLMQETADNLSGQQSVETPPADATPEAGGEIPATIESEPTPTAAPQESPEVVLLKQQLAQQVQQMQQMQQQMQQPPAQQVQSQGDPLDQFIPEYMFQIPDQLMQLMESEDVGERKQGIQYLLSSALKNAHKSMLQQVNGMMTAYVPQQLTQHQQTNELKETIKSDFYSTHKDLNTPEIRQIVAMVTPQVTQELGVSTWSPTLRDAIAARVKAMLQIGVTQPATPANPAPTQFVPGSRPAAPAGGDLTNDILSLL